MINKMILPLIGVFMAGICADTILSLPGESSQGVVKSARFVITLCVICILLSPLGGCDENKEALEEFTAVQSGVTAEESENLYIERIMTESRNSLEKEVSDLLCKNFGIKNAQVCIQLEHEETKDAFEVSIVSATVDLSKAKEDGLSDKVTEEIRKYVETLTGLERVEIIPSHGNDGRDVAS